MTKKKQQIRKHIAQRDQQREEWAAREELYVQEPSRVITVYTTCTLSQSESMQMCIVGGAPAIIVGRSPATIWSDYLAKRAATIKVCSTSAAKLINEQTRKINLIDYPAYHTIEH